jgi:hypothetical protein
VCCESVADSFFRHPLQRQTGSDQTGHAALIHDKTVGPLGFKLRFVTAQSLVREKAVEMLEQLVNGTFFQARIRFVLSLLRIFGETTVWFIAVTPMIYASG